MATNGRRGGDRVLESRHLVGLFLGVVLLCGVFFTLGYVMGRTQYAGALHAETITQRPSPVSAVATAPRENAVVAPAPSEWDFYPKRDSAKKSDVIPANQQAAPAPALETVSETPAPEAEAPPPQPVVFPTKTHTPPPSTTHAAKVSIILQVAALRHKSDAMEMQRLLHKKHFPSFVSPPPRGDTLYRVQVGPYTDERAADAAKAALDRAGFKAIIKH